MNCYPGIEEELNAIFYDSDTKTFKCSICCAEVTHVGLMKIKSEYVKNVCDGKVQIHGGYNNIDDDTDFICWNCWYDEEQKYTFFCSDIFEGPEKTLDAILLHNAEIIKERKKNGREY